MDSKLTLKLDAAAIERGRRYARRRGISLSRMVEQYFNSVSTGASDVARVPVRYHGTVVGRLLDTASQWPGVPGADESRHQDQHRRESS